MGLSMLLPKESQASAGYQVTCRCLIMAICGIAALKTFPSPSSVQQSNSISASCGKAFYAWEYLASHSPWDASEGRDQCGWARCSSCAGPKAKIQTREINLLPSS